MKNSILIVDDEEGIQLALKEILEMEGYSVVTAKTGEEALGALAACHEFSIILLDFKLPDMTGFEFVGKMSNELLVQIPIILLSGNAGLQQMKLPLGVVGAIGKPFDIDDLLDAIQKFSRHFFIPPSSDQRYPEVS